jgi:hypothetical protein
MLGFSSQLLFPSLKQIPLEPFVLIHKAYVLDWSHVEDIKKTRWEKNLRAFPSDIQYYGTLPENVQEWVDNMIFVIPQNLLSEIRRCSLKAVEEWSNMPPLKWEPIPTISPAVSYIQRAFNIIGDCLYDTNTKNYSRGETKSLAPYALAYRFWCRQIDISKLKLYSGIINLETTPLGLPGGDASSKLFNSIDQHIFDISMENKMSKNEKVPEENLLSFLWHHKGKSSKIDDITIVIKELGQITIGSAKIFRSGGLKITGEILKSPKIENIVNSQCSFEIKDSSCTAIITDAKITGVSSTPPPIITIEISKLSADNGNSITLP